MSGGMATTAILLSGPEKRQAKPSARLAAAATADAALLLPVEMWSMIFGVLVQRGTLQTFIAQCGHSPPLPSENVFKVTSGR